MQGGGRHPGCPAGTQPRPYERPGERVDDHHPLIEDFGERHREQSSRDCHEHDDRAHRLVHDDRLERGEAEQPDK